MSEQLKTLLATHADKIRALLPANWPLSPDMPRKAWGDNFVVYELGQLPDGRWAKLHHFLHPDTGPPHCHWCKIESFGIEGSYIERTYQDGNTFDTLRPAGGHHVIEADTIHRLITLPEGEAWTLCLTGPAVRVGYHHDELQEH